MGLRCKCVLCIWLYVWNSYDWILTGWELSTIFITHDIDEAILLSDCIYLLTGQPGTITDEIIISEPKPRRKDFNLTEEFLAYKKKIIEKLGTMWENRSCCLKRHRIAFIDNRFSIVLRNLHYDERKNRDSAFFMCEKIASLHGCSRILGSRNTCAS